MTTADGAEPDLWHDAAHYQPANPGAPQDGLARLLGQRVATLRAFVGAVAAEGDARRRLSGQLGVALAQEASTVQSELWLLPEGAGGPRRLALEARLGALAEAHRQEQVACWRDLELVAREQRTWLKEYLELRQRVALVMPSAVPRSGETDAGA